MSKRLLVVFLLTVLAGIFSLTTVASPDGQTLVFGATGELRTLDPHVSVDNNAWRAIYYCYDRLVEYELGTTELAPGLAESWKVSPDGLTYTFYLRKGIKFIDGTPFNAEAVKFNFDRLLGMALAPSGTFGFIDRVDVVDDFTVNFILKEPFAPGVSAFATDQGNIVGPGVMDHEVNGDWGQDWLTEHSAGTGQFYVEEWTHGVRVVLARNDDYWGEPAKLEKVVIKYVPEAADLRMLLETGEVDIGEKLTVDQIEAMKGTPGVTVFEAPSFCCHYVYMNCQKPYLNDARVRQAISYAVNYDGIINDLWRGTATQMRGPVPMGLVGHDGTVFQYQQDLEKARELLAEAGYPGGGFTLKIMHAPVIPEWRPMALVIQEGLAEIGIEVEIESYAWATLRDKLDKGDFDMSHGYWTPDYADADMFTWFWFNSENWGLAGNRSWYKNAVMDELVTRSRTEVDPDKRLGLFRGIQWIGTSDAVYLYLLQTNYQIVMRDWVKGYIYNPMLLNMPNFPGMYIEK